MATPTFPSRKIARLYQNVPQDQLERFQAFRLRYPYQTIVSKGLPWRVIDTREGKAPLFVPASGTGVAEVSWQTLEHLAQTYRVISLDCPPVSSLQELFAGAVACLDHLGIDQFDALGGSGGTVFLQPFVRCYPQRVRKLALTTPVPPDPARGAQLRNMLRVFRFVPTFLIRALLMRSFERLGGKETTQTELAQVMALTKEIVLYRLRRENFITLFSLVADMTESFSYSPVDLQDWPGRILLVFGGEDPSTPQAVRAQMLALYPQAQVKVFEGAGHGVALSHQEEYFAALDEFLAG